jgi:hypothetical protein
MVNGDISDDDSVSDRQSAGSDSDVNDADYGAELPPVVGTPSSPVVRTPNVAVPSSPRIGVKSVTRVGQKFRVRVVAPKGAHVTVYQNGRKVSAGNKSTFSIRAAAGKRVRFHVVARINGALVKSPVQTFSVRTR